MFHILHLLLFAFLSLERLESLNRNIEQKLSSGIDESTATIFLDRIEQSFLAIPNDDIWSRIPSISPDAPFFFFHQRKAGGEGLRDSLFDAAKLRGLKSYIICVGQNPYNGHHIPCDAYHVKFGMKDISIYAGHLSYGEQFAIQRQDAGSHNRQNISCTTNFREPLSRVLSCLRYRHHIPCLKEVSADKFKEYLLRTDTFGHSCISEPFRIMSGINDEDLLDFDIEDIQLKSAQLRTRTRFRGRRLDEMDAVGIYKRTLSHVAECAPVVLEIPESYELVADRCPQIFRDDNGTNVAIVARKILSTDHASTTGDCAPSKEQTELLMNYTKLERRLYNVVRRKVEDALNNTHTLLIHTYNATNVTGGM